MKRLGILLLLAFFFIGLGGCQFRGYVYIAVAWHMNDPANIPDAIDSDIVALLTPEPGIYYETSAGDHWFETTYGATVIQINFTLEAKRTAIGIEDAFYDIVCDAVTGPALFTVPR